MKLRGKFNRIKKSKTALKPDGVHQVINGHAVTLNAFLLNNKLIPYGSDVIYKRIGNYGVKIYYSLSRKKACSLKRVREIYGIMKKLSRQRDRNS